MTQEHHGPCDGDLSVSDITNIEIHLKYTSDTTETASDKPFLPRVPAIPKDLNRLAFQGCRDITQTGAKRTQTTQTRSARFTPRRRSTFDLFEIPIDPKTAEMSSEKASNPKDKLEGMYQAQIKSADMTEDMQQEAIDIAQEAMAKYSIEKDIAMHIKKTFDERKGPTWHCIVGRNFGSFVTHETKHFIYFYLGHCAILLFKTQ